MSPRRNGWLYGAVAGVLLAVAPLVYHFVLSARPPHVARSEPPRQLAPHALVPTLSQVGDSVLYEFALPLSSVRFEAVDLDYRWPLADMLEPSAALVFNGGFWAWRGQQRAIEGLLFARGVTISPLDTALGGGVLVVQAGRAQLIAAESFAPSAKLELAVQCKPRLVMSGRVMEGLRDTPRAARTALCIRLDGQQLAVILTDPAKPGLTIPELARWLAERGCSDALNLDGGPSTAAAWQEAGVKKSLGAGRELPYAIVVKRR